MVDPGELVKTTLKREFMEEAMNSLEATNSDRQDMERKIDEFFQHFTEVCIYNSFSFARIMAVFSFICSVFRNLHIFISFVNNI